MKIRTSDIKMLFYTDDRLWTLRAVWRGRAVGHVLAVPGDARLMIGEIEVSDDFTLPSMVLGFLVRPPASRRQSLRGQGIGSMLLERIVEEAEKAGLREAWGKIAQRDIDRTPHLLDWYRGRGFEVVPPDAECGEDAIHKVVRALSRREPAADAP